MKTNGLRLHLLLVFGLALSACGDDSSGASPNDAGSDGTASSSSGGSSSGGSSSSSGSSSSGSGSGSGSGSSSSGGDAGSPMPPALGTQIDRMGRPAINTALNNTFNTDATSKGAAKDTYNADTMPSHWSAYIPEFERNLAIYDGLDTVCGNQAAFGALGNPGYATLATVLSGDELWVNTASTTCSLYLGVELNVLGVANTDCGGRTLTENTIDETFNAVAGTLDPKSATFGIVTNGITAPASAPSTTFPYLAGPH